ncbi:hypothetical protein [Lapidilactobacillus salsurivasis]
MNRWHLFGDRVSQTTGFAVLTLVLRFMELGFSLPVLRYFVAVSGGVTIVLLIWTIWQALLTHRGR